MECPKCDYCMGYDGTGHPDVFYCSECDKEYKVKKLSEVSEKMTLKGAWEVVKDDRCIAILYGGEMVVQVFKYAFVRRGEGAVKVWQLAKQRGNEDLCPVAVQVGKRVDLQYLLPSEMTSTVNHTGR